MHYSGKPEVEEMKKLRDEGWYFRDIAKRFNVCEQTAANLVNGKTVERGGKRGGRTKVISIAKTYAAPDFREQDFSQLPDTVLFEHVRECNFIG